MILPQDNFAKLTFLVIDDFQGMRSLLREMLRENGASTIDLAMNGLDAIKQLSGRKYDVVLCDYNLGDGKNGQQVLEEAKIKQLISPTCTWIMITAEKSSDWIMGAVEYQPDAYLIKPITGELLLSRLDKIRTKKQAFAEINQAIINKNYLRAIALCDARLAHDTANATELRRIKGQLLLDAGEPAQAAALFEEVLAEREIPWARTGLGKVCFLKGDFEGASQHCQLSIATNRAYLEAYDWLAKAQQQLKQPEQAEATLAEAVKISPNSAQRQKELGTLALQRGDMALAERAFRKSIQVGEHSVQNAPDAYLGFAKVCGATNKADEALKVLATVQKQFSDTEVKLRVKATEGLIYTQTNNLQRASEAAQEVEQLLQQCASMKNEAAGLEAAQLLLSTGRVESAVSLLQNVVKNNHENSTVTGQVQALFSAAGMAEEGERLVNDSRKEAVELMNSGVMLMREGKVEEALNAIRTARNTMPNNPRVLLNFAYVATIYMQRNGVSPSLINEAKTALLEANRIAPGEKRFAQLQEALSALQ
ncbi:response regulator [Chitinibacter sp. S2-10]|uniref:response regulator n=1 Tax=Chitinibacter sp. S2-10 TaxID=3373597 RepID=UPI003977A684